MKTHDNQLPVKIPGNDQMLGETPLAYTYYKLYRDTPPEARSLRALCHLEVTGKKRSERVIKRWSSEHDWQERVAIYDTMVARAAFQEQLTQRQAEVLAFINEDMDISLKFQKVCKARLEELTRVAENVDCRELRQLALAYRESREWLKDLIIIMQEEKDDAQEMEAWEERAEFF